jgi:hypothetical protein
MAADSATQAAGEEYGMKPISKIAGALAAALEMPCRPGPALDHAPMPPKPKEHAHALEL